MLVQFDNFGRVVGLGTRLNHNLGVILGDGRCYSTGVRSSDLLTLSLVDNKGIYKDQDGRTFIEVHERFMGWGVPFSHFDRYSDGRIYNIDDLKIDYYSDGRIMKIGSVGFLYYSDGRFMDIGSITVRYFSDGRIMNIDNTKFSYYPDGRLMTVGGLKFTYYSDGRISVIGEAYFNK